MNRRNLQIAAVVMAVIVIGAGGWLYTIAQGDTLPASGPITAVPLDLSAPTTAPAATKAPTAAPVATEAPTATQAPTAAPAATNAAITNAIATAAATLAPTDTAVPTKAPTAAPTATERPTAAPVVLTRFKIVQAESQVRFTLNEVLGGQPNTVVGTTNQVAGELAVAPSDLSSAKIGVITVNARTLATDSDERNRSIKNLILNTDSYELITFTPSAITGLSGSGAPGTPYAFQIAGNLTIRDKTVPVVFQATVKAESVTRLSGTATTTVNRGDFGLIIPSVPGVADVSEQVQLTITFVATAS